MAYSARITSDAMTTMPGPLTYDIVLINLNNPSEYERIAETFSHKFGSRFQFISSRELSKDVISEAVSVLSLPIIIMEAVFMLASFLLLLKNLTQTSCSRLNSGFIVNITVIKGYYCWRIKNVSKGS